MKKSGIQQPPPGIGQGAHEYDRPHPIDHNSGLQEDAEMEASFVEDYAIQPEPSRSGESIVLDNGKCVRTTQKETSLYYTYLLIGLVGVTMDELRDQHFHTRAPATFQVEDLDEDEEEGGPGIFPYGGQDEGIFPTPI